jgi:hypothetical protein
VLNNCKRNVNSSNVNGGEGKQSSLILSLSLLTLPSDGRHVRLSVSLQFRNSFACSAATSVRIDLRGVSVGLA